MIELTAEQQAFVDHPSEVYLEACPGAGKTRAVVARVARIAAQLPPRRGLATLSFTNTAVEEFINQCHRVGLDNVTRHPGFTGTFDSFLRQFFIMPGGIEGVDVHPRCINNWATLGVVVRLAGRQAFRGDGVDLDLFDPSTNGIDPLRIGIPGLRKHVADNKPAYERAATRKKLALRKKGYLSAGEVRVEALNRLKDAGWASALGRALAARFAEVLVDEAQDCNPLDCQVLSWLRRHGIPVTVVADPDQAIYEFRDVDPKELRALRDTYDDTNRLALTGNFRSSPAICGFAASLRARASPDTSLGATAAVLEPVHIVPYAAKAAVGRWFYGFLDASGISRSDGIVLAHSRATALRASGLSTAGTGRESHVASMARAIGSHWSSSSSGKTRDSVLQTVERMLLDLTGNAPKDELPSSTAEKRQIDPRWLRRSALELITAVPASCADTDAGRAEWCNKLRGAVHRLGLTYRPRVSEPQYFRAPRTGDWHRMLVPEDGGQMRCATIHEAKGREYEAVCVVIPPGGRTESLLASWKNRAEDEAKRVVYVGATRTRKLLVVAIPNRYRKQLTSILQAARVSSRVHSPLKTVGKDQMLQPRLLG